MPQKPRKLYILGSLFIVLLAASITLLILSTRHANTTAQRAPAEENPRTTDVSTWKTYEDLTRGIRFIYPPTSYLPTKELADCAYLPTKITVIDGSVYLTDDRIFEPDTLSCDHYHFTTQDDITDNRAFVYYYVQVIPVSKSGPEAAIKNYFQDQGCFIAGQEEISNGLYSLWIDAPQIGDGLPSSDCVYPKITYNKARNLIYMLPPKSNGIMHQLSPTDIADGKYNVELF